MALKSLGYVSATRMAVAETGLETLVTKGEAVAFESYLTKEVLEELSEQHQLVLPKTMSKPK